MPGELSRRDSSYGRPVSRSTVRAVTQISDTVNVSRAVIRAKARVGESAMYDVAFLKDTQRQLEQANPDLAEALALIANTTVAAIARSVLDFGSGLD
ncbi:hypothetical protein [Parafrankia sp. BMG5.11]|uniref:hypothetical protein n=1 Tax=Parafrankia sp. BMG5.11 TaxID=222540 RepID=UPI0010398762|nr:hypothetical protein [Parafrankia sp. BMG5.11]TCJ35197.1 hypothetical protein E0504_29350 [Parafrankia sp. BMG5.11]